MERATRTLTIPYGCVLYVPRARGYLARFSDPSSDVRAPLYVDITTIPEWSADAVHMIDLDLDVVRDQQGAVYAVDQDEFTVNIARFGYPDDVVARARAELSAVMGVIRSNEAPFGMRQLASFRWSPHRRDQRTKPDRRVTDPGHLQKELGQSYLVAHEQEITHDRPQ